MSKAAKWLLAVLVVLLLPGMCRTAAAASDRERMDANLDAWFSSNYKSKKTACIGMAEALLDAGYEPAFTAGVIANVACEGNFGQFENIWSYTPERLLQVYPGLGSPGHTHNYIAHMRGFTQFDSCGHDHSEYANYSGKLVYNGVSLKALTALVEHYREENWRARFGLGSVQWTADRAALLVGFYCDEAGDADQITYAQCVRAEQRCMLYELANTRTGALNSWRTRHAAAPNTEASAYDAGYYVCYYYETPSGYQTVSVSRGNLAQTIYRAMIEGTSYAQRDTQAPTVRRADLEGLSAFGYDVVVEAEDNCGIAALELCAWNEKLGREGALRMTQRFDNETPAVYRFHVARSDFSGAPEGIYHTEVTAVDRSGNRSAVKTAETVHVEAGSPVIRAVQVLNVTREGFDLAITAEDGVGVEGLLAAVWQDAAGSSDLTWQTVETAGGAYVSAVLHVDVSDHGGARDTMYHASLFAYDRCGNLSQAFSAGPVWVDGTPPTITDVRIAQTDARSFVVSAAAEDVSGVKSFRFRVWTTWRGPDDAAVTETAAEQGAAQCRMTIDKHGGEYGRYLVEVTAMDEQGNQNGAPMSASVILRDTAAGTVLLREADRTYFGGRTFLLLEAEVMTGTGERRSPGWEEAQALCEGMDGTLAMIRSAGENRAAADMVRRAGSPCWIGASDAQTEGVFLWTSGQRTSYANWAACQPDDAGGFPGVGHSEDYVLMQPDGTWTDAPYQTAAGQRRLLLCELAGNDLSGLRVLRLPAGIKRVEEESFAGAGCEAVVIPAGCTGIGSRAFAGCPGLRFVFLPEAGIDIAPDAFDAGVQLIWP